MKHMMKTYNHRKYGMKIAASLSLALLTVGMVSQALAGPATVEKDAIWAHGRLYGTVATDTNFKSPPPQSTDIIFAFSLTGQHSVAEAAPGDPNYNGGRWNVMIVTLTDTGMAMFDADMDGVLDDPALELTDAEEVLDYASQGFLTITPAHFYFECPLRPQRGR